MGICECLERPPLFLLCSKVGKCRHDIDKNEEDSGISGSHESMISRAASLKMIEKSQNK